MLPISLPSLARSGCFSLRSLSSERSASRSYNSHSPLAPLATSFHFPFGLPGFLHVPKRWDFPASMFFPEKAGFQETPCMGPFFSLYLIWVICLSQFHTGGHQVNQMGGLVFKLSPQALEQFPLASELQAVHLFPPHGPSVYIRGMAYYSHWPMLFRIRDRCPHPRSLLRFPASSPPRHGSLWESYPFVNRLPSSVLKFRDPVFVLDTFLPTHALRTTTIIGDKNN